MSESVFEFIIFLLTSTGAFTVISVILELLFFKIGFKQIYSFISKFNSFLFPFNILMCFCLFLFCIYGYSFPYKNIEVNNDFIFRNPPEMLQPEEMAAGVRFVDWNDNFDFANEIMINLENNQIRNDTQNVHDSNVVKSQKNNFNKLKELVNMKDLLSKDNVVQKVTNYIINDFDGDSNTKSNAIIALHKIVAVNKHIISLDDKEVNILRYVVSRIFQENNKKNKDNLLHNLSINLSQCVVGKNVTVICETGRVSQLLSTLEIADENKDFKILPKWALEEHIISTIANTRNKICDSLDKKDLETYIKIDPNEEEIKLVNKINNQITEEIQNTLQKEYIETGLINTDNLEKIINPHMEEFKPE